eukprot:TRINITY_DN5049_c0_g2_i1.p1 TRINITY_DN5049_c0_g2~~TRINITY_DN5049_c0_g2_i1.p1  ORF type:complete len:152 (+),score=20.44 TRINITY_DN5049_c0_g2_i1:801-1256(+)
MFPTCSNTQTISICTRKDTSIYKSPVNKDSKCCYEGACKENPWNDSGNSYTVTPRTVNKGDDIEHFGNPRTSFLKYHSNGCKIDDCHGDDEKEGESDGWFMEERRWDYVFVAVDSVTGTQEADQGGESHDEYCFRLKGGRVYSSRLLFFWG